MNEIHKVIDPKGDVLLILTPSTEPFAPWPEQNQDDEEQVQEELKEDKPHPNFPQPEPFKTLVSSHALRLASPVLAGMFEGSWKESEVQSDGLRHTAISEFDPLAMQHVLNIFHHKIKSVPKALSLEELSKVAVIVDYWQCHEAVALFSDLWIDALKNDIPRGRFNRDVVLWLFVAVTFNREKTKDAMLQLALTHGTQPFDNLGLPILPNLVDYIDMKREKALEFLANPLIALLEKLQNGYCIFNCDSYNLGKLVKHLKAINMYPVPPKPFHGAALFEISYMIREQMQPSDPYSPDLHSGVILPRTCPQESIRWDLLDKLKSDTLQDLNLRG